MSDNPFDDSDVQALQTQVAEDSYDIPSKAAPTKSNKNSSAKKITSKDEETIAVSILSSMKDSVVNDYKQQTAQQVDHNPPPETPAWCVRAFNWLPVRWLAFLGGMLLIALPIVQIVFGSTFSEFFVDVYLIFFGFLVLIIEAPVFVLTRKAQLAIYYWFRLLSRTWGRAWFYIFVSIICFRQSDIASIFVGIWMLFVGFLMFVYSRFAAAKYVRIYFFVVAGTENEDMKQRMRTKFDELDLDKDGHIGSLEIVQLASQAGRTLSNAERNAIQTFLDISCNGNVSKDDFMKQFSTYNVKQKYL